MPAELDVDKEQVKMLVQAIGCREAARQMKISENTVLAWASRYGWMAEIRKAAEPQPAAQPLPASMRKQPAIGAISASEALANTLRERQGEIALHQSKYLVRASEKLASVDDDKLLDHAVTGKTLADMKSKVYPETSQTGPTLNLLVMGGLDAE